MSRRREVLRDERGLTIVELLIAVILFGIVTASALTFLRDQGRSYARGADAADMLQNLRYAGSLIEQEIRTGGSNVLEGQPVLVHVDEDVLVFNADLTSNVPNDLFAIYVDVDAPDGAVSAMTRVMRTTLANSSFAYPDTTYLTASGTNGAAETVSFFFRPDSSTSRRDDWVLLKQVNDAEAELLARNLLRHGDRPFFEYIRKVTPSSAAPYLEVVPDDELPLSHTEPIHRGPADVGAAAEIDDLVGVRVAIGATDGRSGASETRRFILQAIRLSNASTSLRYTCGDEPIFGRDLELSEVQVSGKAAIELTWEAAVDETGGEKDVVRYIIYRRVGSTSDWGDPYVSIPAGKSDYTYVDSQVLVGETYRYAVVAQDCSPLMSELVDAGPLTVSSGGGGGGDDDDDDDDGSG